MTWNVASATRFVIQIEDDHEQVFEGEFDSPVELGRQRHGEAGPFAHTQQGRETRLVVAASNEDTVSRQHLLLEPLADRRIRVTNLSAVRAVLMSDGSELKPNHDAGVFATPLSFLLGGRLIRVSFPHEDEDDLRSLAGDKTLVPNAESQSFLPFPSLKSSLLPQGELESLLRWMQSTISVLQVAASSEEFFPRAAQALVDIVDLDTGAVLLNRHGRWEIAVLKTRPGLPAADEWVPSQKVLRKITEERRTIYQTPSQAISDGHSLFGVTAVVAAPILDASGAILGALYGDRRQPGTDEVLPSISRLDAQLVELLASSVAVGLARLAQEQAALAARVQFEQFFTPELAKQLAAEPDLLTGKTSEITLVFCDIRRFSRIAERIGPEKTVAFINDVFGALSDCVLRESGVLVDYIGDEMIAMWGAPQVQPDHARRACRAAIEMLDVIEVLNARWAELLGGPFEIGIGINTGLAHVGNTGSIRKFKYGPLGNTVNLASRVQGASKYFKSRLLVTGTTYRELGNEFASRRLAQVRVVNISEPVTLYELQPPHRPDWDRLRTVYEQALVAFERGDFREATRVLGNILSQTPDDGPSVVLLSRTVQMLSTDSTTFDPVWDLPGK